MAMFGKMGQSPYFTFNPFSDPVSGSAANGSIGGNFGLNTGLEMALPADAYADQRPTSGGLFGRLGQSLKGIDWGTTLAGGLADGIATHFGAQPAFGPAVQEATQQRQEYEKAAMLAKLKAQLHDDDSPYVKDAIRIGLTPGTAEFARWVTRMRSAPRIVANDQGIYNMDTDNYGLWGGQGGSQPSGPPPEAIRELQADPSGAAEFDQVFGAGASRRYLGQ